MNRNIKLIPELRFPEFENEGTWKKIRLAEFNQLPSGDGNWILSKNITTNGEYKIVQLSSIGFGIFKEKDLKTISSETFLELKGTPIQKGDLLINRMVDSDKINCCIFPEDGNYVTSVDVCWIRQNRFIDNYFLMSFLCTGSSQRSLLSLSSGGGRVRISKNNLFEKFIFSLPQNPFEQQKIASCLFSLDEVIAAHNQRLEALKEHKIGLMQNLFPQEGGSVPKYRFPEFEGDGEWVEKKLGELGEFLGGGTPSRTNSEYWTGTIPWISSSDVKEDDIHNIKISQFINEIAIVESATKIIPIGSILFVSRVGVGKLAINNEELCTSQDFTSFIPTEILNLFVAYYFSANKNLLQALSQGTSIKGFSKGDLENSKISYPKNKIEQQKIASCLSALDDLINAQTEKIEQLQLHKKGLMQGLFPKVE